jgi:hypothetical protein
MDSNDAEFDMMDDDIDWSAVVLPQDSARTVGNVPAIPVSTTITMGTSSSHVNNQNHFSPPVIDLTGQEVETSNPHHYQNGESNHNHPNRNRNHNHNHNQNEDNENLKQQIQKLQNILAQKDEQLFSLESSIATVEAETAYIIKNNQLKVEQQIKAKDDQLRFLEKEVGMKNVALVRLKKSMNGSTSMGTFSISNSVGKNAASSVGDNVNILNNMNMNRASDHISNSTFISGPETNIGNFDSFGMNANSMDGRTRIGAYAYNGNSAMDIDSHSPQSQVPVPMHDNFLNDTNPAATATASIATTNHNSTRNRTPPLDNDHNESVSSHERDVSISAKRDNVKHSKTATVPVSGNVATGARHSVEHYQADDRANGEPMSISEPHTSQSQSQPINSENAESILVSERREEMVAVLSHLLRCCEQSSPIQGCHTGNASSVSSSMPVIASASNSFLYLRKSESVEKRKPKNAKKRSRAQVEGRTSTYTGMQESNYLDLQGECEDEREGINKGILSKDYVVVRDLLLHLLQAYSCTTYKDTDSHTHLRENISSLKSIDSLSRFLHLPGVGYIAKEIVSMIGFGNAMNGQNGDAQCNPPPSDMVSLSILVELCCISAKAREHVRTWLSSCHNDHDMHKESGEAYCGNLNTHANSSILSRVRGMPKKYQECIKDVEEYDKTHDHSHNHERSEYKRQMWDSYDRAVVTKSFRDSIMAWIMDGSSSKLEQSRALYLQRTSLKLLRVLMVDAPRHDFVSMFKCIVFHRGTPRKSGEESIHGKNDIISILEKSSVSGLNHVGRRHHLLIKDNDETSYSTILGVVEFKAPDKTMIEIKTCIIQLLHHLAQCPEANRALLDPNIMTNPHYDIHVCYGRRIMAAVLDDLQCAILPFLSEKELTSKEFPLDIMLRYGTSIARLLVSMSENGFILMRTEMKVGGKPMTGNEEHEFATSCIGVMSDYLERSTLLLLSHANYQSRGRSLNADRNGWCSIRETVESVVFFLYTIYHRSCREGVGGFPSFHAILSDAERIQPVHSSFKTILRFEEFDNLARCRVRTMVQSLIDQ